MMKTLLVTAGLAALMAAPAHAAAISVAYSDDFQEKLEDELGEREGERLTEYITNALERELDRQGVDVARVDVTIEDAKPNRPTFEQLRQRPNLDFGRSISIGGADLRAVAYGVDGEVVGEFQYDWFENDLRDVVGSGTWTDARRASRQFARRFTASLSNG